MIARHQFSQVGELALHAIIVPLVDLNIAESEHVSDFLGFLPWPEANLLKLGFKLLSFSLSKLTPFTIVSPRLGFHRQRRTLSKRPCTQWLLQSCLGGLLVSWCTFIIVRLFRRGILFRQLFGWFLFSQAYGDLDDFKNLPASHDGASSWLRLHLRLRLHLHLRLHLRLHRLLVWLF